MSTSIKTELLVENKMGIHARPAAMFVKIASRYEAEIFVEKDGERVNGKSIMGLMMLAAGPGSRLVLEAIGVDASRRRVDPTTGKPLRRGLMAIALQRLWK